MDRPAMKRLIAAIEAGQVDCVVVYKVDRLSRSVPDFAKIMELFDRQEERGSRFRYWNCERFDRVAVPWHDEKGSYQRRFDCGRPIPWSDPLPLSHPTRRPADRTGNCPRQQ
jgi:resolvase-like protein